ncbi:unnamed protein product [Chrysoparadoxa australica]
MNAREKEIPCILALPQTPPLTSLASLLNCPFTSMVALVSNPFRVYDRRMLSLQKPGLDSPSTPSMCFVPPHAHCGPYTRQDLHATSVEFSPDGSCLLAHYHADHCYTFDVRGASGACESPPPTGYTMPQPPIIDYDQGPSPAADDPTPSPGMALLIHELEMSPAAGTSSNAASVLVNKLTSELASMHARLQAWDEGRRRKPQSRAVGHCAAEMRRLLAKGYEMRAKYLLARKWKGDAYLAVCDLTRAKELASQDEQEHSVHWQYIMALWELDQKAWCMKLCREFQDRFPTHARMADEILGAATVDEATAESKEGEDEGEKPRAPAAAAEDQGSVCSQGSEGSGTEERKGDERELSEEGRRAPAPGIKQSDGALMLKQRIKKVALRTRLWSYALGDDAAAERGLELPDGEAPIIPVFQQRFCGAANVATDIKEATFLGRSGAYVISGSDDGRFYIWDGQTGDLMTAHRADADVINCVRGHPLDAVIATAGIGNTIKLWAPTASSSTVPANMTDLVCQNQCQNQSARVWGMAEGLPLLQIFMDMVAQSEGEEHERTGDERDERGAECVQS